MTDKITEKVTLGKNYYLSLPFSENSRFSAYYCRLCQCSADFASSEYSCVRSFKSRYSISEDAEGMLVSVTLTARIKDSEGKIECRKKVISDLWKDFRLISHSCSEI